MGLPRGTRRVALIGLGLIALGLLVVATVASKRALGVALGVNVDASVVLIAGALLMAGAAGHVVSSGAAAPRGLRTVAWCVLVLPTVLALFASGIFALFAFFLQPHAVFLLLAMLWCPVLILWTVFGITVVVTGRPLPRLYRCALR